MTLKKDGNTSPDTSTSISKAGPAATISIGGYSNPRIEAGSSCNIVMASSVDAEDGTQINDGDTHWSLTTNPSTTHLTVSSTNKRNATITGVVNVDTNVALTATYSANPAINTQIYFPIKTYTVTEPEPDVTITAYTPTYGSKFIEGNPIDFSVNSTGIPEDSTDYKVEYVQHYQGKNIVIAVSTRPPQFKAPSTAVRRGLPSSPWGILTKQNDPDVNIALAYFYYVVDFAPLTIAPSSPPHNEIYKVGDAIEFAIDPTGFVDKAGEFYTAEYYNEAGALIGTSAEFYYNFYMPYVIPQDSPSNVAIHVKLVDSRRPDEVIETTINYTVTQ